MWMIGCGHMGGAIARGILNRSAVSSLNIIKPTALPDDLASRAAYYSTIDDASGLDQAQICMLAVKPQKLDGVCEALAPCLPESCLVLSVAAGKTLGGIAKHFPAAQPVIRIMPNTPAAIGKGASVLCANEAASAGHKDMAAHIMQSCGTVEWLDDERLMNAVTGVSGSGPAYLFYFIEALENAGRAAGLPGDLAAALARQTIIGAAALAEDQADITPATLRENVTSPGGTTAAALDILMKGTLEDLIKDAVQAAAKRGEELS